MARRALVLLSLCALIACGVWWSWPDAGERPSGEAMVASPRSAPPEAARERVEPTSPAASMAGERELVPDPASSGAGVPGDMVQVRVLGSDGKPLAGIDVHYACQKDANAAFAALATDEQARLRDDSELCLSRLGTVAMTDAAGIARWPWCELPRGWWRCVARHGEHFGETSVSMTASASMVHDLVLGADREFTVQVLDSTRQPAPDVSLRATFASRTEPERESGLEPWRTRADGRFVAKHVQTWSDRIAPRGAMLPASIVTDLPGIDARGEVDVANPPTEPVVLTLPPAGAIEVTVRDALGQPVAGERYELTEDVAKPERADGATTDKAGIARFPFVGLARQWRLLREHTAPHRAKVVEGPRAAGEVVRVLLQPDAAPALTGQLLRDGVAVANTAFTISTAFGSNKTDAEGRFRVAVDAGWRDKMISQLDVCTVSADGYDGSIATWRGDVVLSIGEHDLGALTLQPDAVVCAGQLIAPAGEPLSPDLRLGVELATPPAQAPSGRLSLRPRRDADGHFTFYGDAPTGAVQLTVETSNHYLPVPPVPFVVGARDLRIELHRGGSVRASIVAGSQLAAFSLQPMLVPIGQPVAMPDYARFQPRFDPRMPNDHEFVSAEPLETAYTWPSLAPGHYRLEIGTRCVHRPILVIQDVVVVDGQRNEEPRLQHLEVPGLRTIDITLPQVVDGPPTAMGHGVIFVLEGEEPGEQCWQIDDRTAHFAATQPLDLLVRMPGYRDRTVRGIVADQTIELAPGLPVTLRCEAFSPPVGSTVTLALECLDDALTTRGPAVYSAAGAHGRTYRMPQGKAAVAAGAAKLLLSAAGRYRVTGSLRLADGSGTELDVAPVELTVGSDGGQFDVVLSKR